MILILMNRDCLISRNSSLFFILDTWGDYLISKVSYDSEHLISVVIRHRDTDNGISKGQPIDRLTVSSDIKNGLVYFTIYSGTNSWKKGKQIFTYSINGTPYLRIDKNKVKLDNLGDLPEVSLDKSDSEKQIQELELQPEPEVTPSSSRGSLPKESSEELPQELELQPEPDTVSEPEPQDEEATPEQLSQVSDLQNQIDELENMLSSNILSTPEPEPQDEEATPEQLSQVSDLQNQIDELEDVLFSQLHPSSEEATPEQISQVKELEKEIEILESADIEHEIIQTLQKQNKKLDDIEKKLLTTNVKKTTESEILEAYCVKCKTKRPIKNPQETVMKNGRNALKGFCSVCNCKVFRIVKMKK